MKKLLIPIIFTLLASPGYGQNNKSNGKIAFYSTRDGHHEIYVINTDVSNLRRLTFGDANNLCPAFSFDGKKIAFLSDRDGNKEIYLMNTDRTKQRRLTNHPAGEYWQSWAVKGEKTEHFIDLGNTKIETNSELFKIEKIDNNVVLLMKNNLYDTTVNEVYNNIIDDITGKVALFSDNYLNFIIEAEFKFLENHLDMEDAGWYGLVFRAADTENFELIWFMPITGNTENIPHISVAHSIVPWWSEAYQKQKKGSADLPSDKWFKVKLKVLGDYFYLYVENKFIFKKRISYYLKEGKCGFFVGTATDAAIRNISIIEI